MAATPGQGGRLIAAPDGLPSGKSLAIGAGGTVVLSSGLAVAGAQGNPTGHAAPVPEPGTLTLLVAGVAALGVAARRRKKQAPAPRALMSSSRVGRVFNLPIQANA